MSSFTSRRVRARDRSIVLCVVLGCTPGLRADEIPPIASDEPLATTFSLEGVARSLDAAALAWQEQRKCGTCHTNFAHVMLRSSLEPVVPEPGSVRAYIEGIVTERWPSKGPRWDAEVVVAATTLAWNDRARARLAKTSEGERTLSPTTRAAFERMGTLQRDDGSWNWLKCGWPPMESDDHYGVTFAALGIGAAPASFRETELAKKMLAGIRRYLETHPGPSLHHRAMVVWASTLVDGLVDASARTVTLDALLAAQRADGGWAVASLFEGWEEHRRKDDVAQSLEVGDGYGTAFALVVARSAGVAEDDARIRRGVQWLRTHQRVSGRWFTPSPTEDSKHYLSNAGTAFAAYALALCGEVSRGEGTESEQGSEDAPRTQQAPDSTR